MTLSHYLRRCLKQIELIVLTKLIELETYTWIPPQRIFPF